MLYFLDMQKITAHSLIWQDMAEVFFAGITTLKAFMSEKIGVSKHIPYLQQGESSHMQYCWYATQRSVPVNAIFWVGSASFIPLQLKIHFSFVPKSPTWYHLMKYFNQNFVDYFSPTHTIYINITYVLHICTKNINATKICWAFTEFLKNTSMWN